MSHNHRQSIIDVAALSDYTPFVTLFLGLDDFRQSVLLYIVILDKIRPFCYSTTTRVGPSTNHLQP